MKRKKIDYAPYDLFLAKSSIEIKEIFFEIKEMIQTLDRTLFEQINKSMLTLKKRGKLRLRGVVWLQPGVNYLILYFAKDKYSSLLFEIFPDGFGGYPYIKVTAENFDLNEINRLSEKALAKVNSVIS